MIVSDRHDVQLALGELESCSALCRAIWPFNCCVPACHLRWRVVIARSRGEPTPESQSKYQLALPFGTSWCATQISRGARSAASSCVARL